MIILNVSVKLLMSLESSPEISKQCIFHFWKICLLVKNLHVSMTNATLCHTCKGHTRTLWCAIGVGTSRGSLSWCWCGTSSSYKSLIKEKWCVDLTMDTLHLKYPLVLLGSEGSALTLPLFLRSPRIKTLCHCSSTMTKDHFFIIS